MASQLKNIGKRISIPSSLGSSIESSRLKVKSWISTSSTAYDPLYLQSDDIKDLEIEGWPTEARPLKKSRLTYFTRLFYDVLAIGATIPFLYLGLYVAKNHGEPISHYYWSKVLEAMKLAVTLFPIVFSAVMSRLTRTIATWQLERGARLGHLEQLFSSSTVFNTVSTQFLLGSFNKLAVGLVFLWALSPLGGQSSLRIVKFETRQFFSNSTARYFDTDQMSFFERGADVAGLASATNARYVAALVGSRDYWANDPWGNVKIPMIKHLKPDSDGWHRVDPLKIREYSSFIGVPLPTFSFLENNTFGMETSYFDLDCYNKTPYQFEPLISNVTFKDLGKYKPRIVRVPGNSYLGSNGTEYCPKVNCQISLSMGISHYIENWTFPSENLTDFDKVIGNKEQFLAEPPTIVVHAKHSKGLVFQCGIKRVYVESSVTCGPTSPRRTGISCRVTAIRDSLRPHPPPDITPFLFAGTFLSFSRHLAQSGGPGQPGTPTLTERFLYSNAYPLAATPEKWSYPSNDELSKGLTKVFNTYFLSSLLPAASTYDPNGPPKGNFSEREAPSLVTVEGGVCIVSGIWLTIFMFSSLVMFCAALASAFLAQRTSIPDVLGYVSTMTRDARYFPLPKGGSQLDGLERSKVLRKSVVRLGDVKGFDDELGYLAFAEAKGVMRPKKGKLYE